MIIYHQPWSKVGVSYLATSRSDIQVGSFIADTYPLFGCDRKSTDVGVVKYSPDGLSRDKYEIGAFISGIQAKDNDYKVKISASITSSEITIKITSTSSPSV